MNRTALAILLPVLISLGPCAPAYAGAGSAKVYRVGMLFGGAPPTPEQPSANFEVFRQSLRNLGYVEGKNLALEPRWADSHYDRHDAFLAEFLRLGVDVIVTAHTPAAVAAHKATKTVPIVMAVSADPLQAGLVQNLARPGGNVTGLTLMGPELAGKRLELMKELVPGLARVALCYVKGMRAFPVVADWLSANQAAATSLGLSVVLIEVGSDADAWTSAFREIAAAGAHGVAIIEGPRFLSERQEIVALAARHRIPVVYPFHDYVHDGGLMSYGADLRELFASAAKYVDKILRGASPAVLPIERPTKFDLVINSRAAAALGLAIPASLLQRSDQVIP